jgi:hypothetical protein
LGDIEILVIHGPVQRGHAVDLRGVHVGALLQQCAHRRRIVLLDGVGQRRFRFDSRSAGRVQVNRKNNCQQP